MTASIIGPDCEDGVARIVIDRPDHMNALNDETRRGLEDAVEAVVCGGEAGALIITGAGDKAFVAGSDVGELIDLDPARSEALSLDIMDFHERLRRMPIVTIAAINGWCLGGGLELALACDIRIAGENARFGLPEISLGIMPGGGGTARLGRVVGAALARSLCLSGEIIDAERAYGMGLVSAVVPASDLAAEAKALGRKIAGYSPHAIGQLKSTLDMAEHCDLLTAQQVEAKACALCFGTPAQKDAMAAFLKRQLKK
jgi:enoyl-CoA hydratase